MRTGAPPPLVGRAPVRVGLPTGTRAASGRAGVSSPDGSSSGVGSTTSG
ncbi:hypothetical protein [Saccharothrix sp. NRRL B-16314]|nr:hypothetical protein [Saccharothrix sp. NRRL B-16314]